MHTEFMAMINSRSKQPLTRYLRESISHDFIS